jgi:hypothetical protein
MEQSIDGVGVVTVWCEEHWWRGRYQPRSQPPVRCPKCPAESQPKGGEETMARGGSPQSVIESPTSIRIKSDRASYLAALFIQISDKESERTEYCRKVNGELKKLKKEARDVAQELKSGRQFEMFSDEIARVAAGVDPELDDEDSGDEDVDDEEETH